MYGGSIKKHTYVDGLSYVDALATINSTDLENKTPDEIMNIMIDKIQQRLPETDIKKGKLAVTVSFSDGCEIQILPAIKTKTGVKIASQDGLNWSKVIKPDNFA